MIDLALDPSETRTPAAAAQHPPVGRASHRLSHRPWGRIALFGLLGIAGTGAFASAASTFLAGLAGPQRAPAAIRQRAADWPDLKDGLPVLATGSVAVLPAIVPPGPVASAIPGAPRAGAVALEAATARKTRALPEIVDVPVIGPARQVSLVAPARTVAALAPLPAETIHARTTATTFAALPAEPAQAQPSSAKAVPARVPAAKLPLSEKPAAEKPVRKPVMVEAKALPADAPDRDTPDEATEVFGIKVPSLAPAGRKIRESVEALGDAVRGLPDRF
ncbi:hypothetical protein [uncultured Methylobacterium sp.]|uniref:hypothetical protein n=1 Tax=uncultured Methylobacterium sp. TaxID=157278 RepID=UPI0035C96924